MGLFDNLMFNASPFAALANSFPSAVNQTFGFDPSTIDWKKLGGVLQGLDTDPAKTIAGMLPQQPLSFNDRYGPAMANPLGAPPMPAPINVAAPPQGGQGIPQTQQPELAQLPPQAQPTAFQPPPQQQAAPQAPSRSFMDRIQGGLGIIAGDKPEWKQIGTDLTGNPQYGFVNSAMQTINGQPLGAGGAGGGIVSFPKDAQGNPLQGTQLLNHLSKVDPTAASYIEAIRRGDASVTGRNLQKYLPLATLVYPDLQQFNYDARKKTATDFAPGGKSANNVKALDTVGGHLEKMIDAFGNLGNTWQPEFNSFKNWLAVRGGKGDVGAFDTAATGVANELGSVFRSVGMSDYEIKSWRDKITASASPEQFKANMSMLLDMLKTRRDVLAEQHAPIGDLPQGAFKNLDGAITKAERVLGGNSAQPSAKPGVTSTGVRWSVQ